MRTTEQRFWAKVDKRGPNDCWEWTGASSGKYSAEGKRYGNFHYDGRVGKAHRYSLEQKLGIQMSSDQHALHKCDNPPCVNPEHLFLGDNFTNQQDAVNKNRWSNGNCVKTHCKRGHKFTDATTRINPRGERVCKPCDKILQAEYKARKRLLTQREQ